MKNDAINYLKHPRKEIYVITNKLGLFTYKPISNTLESWLDCPDCGSRGRALDTDKMCFCSKCDIYYNHKGEIFIYTKSGDLRKLAG